jgi:polyhydroxyalkanoate synthase
MITVSDLLPDSRIRPFPARKEASITSTYTAPQHGPRPLTLFLSLLQKESAGDPALTAAAMAGLRAYQAAPRLPRPAEMPVVASAGRAVLRDYGGSGRPTIFVPSLINPPDVLDLAEANSMLRWLSQHDVQPLMVDWGAPTAAERDLAIAGHVETMLLPLIDSIGPDAALVGYCLGGTMAVAAAVLRQIDRLALIASPWHFSGYPEASRAELDALWTAGQPLAEQLGLFPMELLQAAFWTLDPARVVAKYAEFGRLAPDSAAARAFVALEDWSNSGAPLTLAAGRELVEAFMRDDDPGGARWTVAGTKIDPKTIACPVLEVTSRSDRIVPMRTAAGVGRQLPLGQGHVGMIVGSRARALLWEPLAEWLSQSPHGLAGTR